jgi:hypothetical protein
MTKAANDNLPILIRHPRLLRKKHDHGCSRDQAPKEQEQTNEDRELAMIYARIKWLNWMEFAFMKKRSAANDGQVEPTGRRVVS